MNVRGVVAPRKGSPVTTVRASIVAAPGVTDLGASQVTAFVNTFDTHDMKAVMAVLSMSTVEARDVAARLVKAADEADAQARSRVSP